jgi:hypothetical protein
MAELTGVNFGLAFDALIEVRASAGNSYGLAAAPSPTNTIGARIRRAPDQMAIASLTSVAESQIDITWTPLSAPEDGNSAVTSYNVYWDNGGGSTTIALALVDSLTTTLSVPGLTGGSTY